MNGRHASLVAVMLAAPATSLAAPELHGYVSATTDYVFRGVSYSNSNPAVQAGLELSHSTGFFGGLWASTVDIDSLHGDGRDREFRYYGGYTHALSNRWTFSATAIAYRFPGTGSQFEYDYEELGVAINYDDTVWLEYSIAPDVFNADYTTHNLEIFHERPLPLGLSASLGAGWHDTSEFATEDYTYWQAGLSRNFGSIGVDLRYHDTSRSVPFFSSDDRARERVVLSVSASF